MMFLVSNDSNIVSTDGVPETDDLEFYTDPRSKTLQGDQDAGPYE